MNLENLLVSENGQVILSHAEGKPAFYGEGAYDLVGVGDAKIRLAPVVAIVSRHSRLAARESEFFWQASECLLMEIEPDVIPAPPEPSKSIIFSAHTNLFIEIAIVVAQP